MTPEQAKSAVMAETAMALAVHGEFRSAHEGFAILKEEVDELWDEIKRKENDPERKRNMKQEAIQVGAMAVKFLICCCDE